MRHTYRNLAVGLALLVGAGACADLDVVNPNDADAGRALDTASDVVSLIAGSYNAWFNGVYSTGGPGQFLSNASFQHTAPWANFGMEFYGRIPRQAIVNDVADTYYPNVTRVWYRSYRAIAAVADGLRALEDPEIAAELSADEILQAQAYGKFVLGLSHATLAVLYDGGFVIDETVAVTDEAGLPIPQPFVEYPALMTAALGYFDQAIALATGADFDELPTTWMQADVSAADLVALSHSMKARYRAAIARTPAERQAVDWTAVIADVDAGVSADFVQDMNGDEDWFNGPAFYGGYAGWAESPYYIYGMADQSGNYQAWLDVPVAEKHPDVNGNPTLIITPDTRFPQGATVTEQQENPGTYYASTVDITDVWARPDRGTWRWSYYKDERYELYFTDTDFHHNEIDVNEMRLLAAEGHYWNNNLGAAADLINVTRTAAGLNATDAAGTNTSCVPKLPNGECGDLLEMLKWEKRIEVMHEGLFGATWYFDGRAWGDLYFGTPLQFPVPCQELQTLGMLPCYSFGGSGGTMASTGSSYAYPHEQ